MMNGIQLNDSVVASLGGAGPDIRADAIPDWIPASVRLYLAHVEQGRAIRSLARGVECSASTVMRRIHRVEQSRDDPLIDSALARLARFQRPAETANMSGHREGKTMSATIRQGSLLPQTDALEKEARRILRRLCEPGAVLAVAAHMEMGVVVRETADGRTHRVAVTERVMAEAMALREWIKATAGGKIVRYHITATGRQALKRMIASDEAARMGMAEAATPFADQHRDWAVEGPHAAGTDRPMGHDGPQGGRRVRMRYNMAESPITALARRKDKNGESWLSDDLVRAAERLREDFELAQLGPQVSQNWDRFLAPADRGAFQSGSGGEGGSAAARARVAAALADLGTGLGDMVLRTCCFLEGIEAAERRLGWSARSGKVVLRIALTRLKNFYAREGQDQMIG